MRRRFAYVLMGLGLLWVATVFLVQVLVAFQAPFFDAGVFLLWPLSAHDVAALPGIGALMLGAYMMSDQR